MSYWKMIKEVLDCQFCDFSMGMKMRQNTLRWVWGVGRVCGRFKCDPLCCLPDGLSYSAFPRDL